MGNGKKEHGTIGLMILTVIIIFCVIAIIVGGFRMIKKNEDAKLIAASDTEYIENKQEREELKRQEEQDKEDEREAEEEVQDTEKTLKSQENSEAQESDKTKNSSQPQTDADKQESDNTDSQKTDKSEASQTDADTDSDAQYNITASSDSEEEVDEESSEDDKVYLIKGDEKSSNRYEKAKHLSYTTTVKYTVQNLSKLDSYGLKITRNEIYARHGRMFNDKDLQEYFERQKWYVPQTASNDFDTSCLNEVERYNIELIKTYEQQVGGR